MVNDELMEDALDDLDDLIQYFELEKKRLKKCIEKASEEWAFSEAEAFAKAYHKVSARLDVLKNLKEPGFDERAYLYQSLVSLEEQKKEHADNPDLVRHFTLELKEVNQALDKLENTSHFLVDTQHIDDAIFLLIKGSIESFRLHMYKRERMVFDFVLVNNEVQIGFSYRPGAIHPSREKRFRKIGFSQIDESRLVRSIDVSNSNNVQKIKQLLAVIFFDIFNSTWFDSPAELEIRYKSI
jgi:hypothetical protein